MRARRVRCNTRVYEHELDLLKQIAEREHQSLSAILRNFILAGMHDYRKVHAMTFSPPSFKSPALGYKNLMRG